jgi:flagellar biosynthesis protein FlhG
MNPLEPISDFVNHRSSLEFEGKPCKESVRRYPRVISVSSGKGGVGKTNVVANLGVALTQLGKRVFVLDAELGLANVDILLGLTPRYTIEHFFKRQKTLKEILIKGPGGMFIMPASSGTPELAALNAGQKFHLLDEFEQLADHLDILLIDGGAGISPNVLFFNMAAQETVTIVTPEPTSIASAYTLIRILSTKYSRRNFSILVNLASDEEEAQQAFQELFLHVDRCLKSPSLEYLGFIPFDRRICEAVKLQKTVLEIFPQCPVSQRFRELAQLILDKPISRKERGNVQFFSRSLLRSAN